MIALVLLLGVVLSTWVPWTLKEKISGWVGPLLKLNLIGLGFGLTCRDFLSIDSRHIAMVFFGVGLTLVLGFFLGKYFKLNPVVSTLITVGTAICGGSAIAAVSPIVKAKNQDMVVSLAAVFLLNSLAMLLFPFVGHVLALSQTLFGVWAGIAIHDTSSVIGSAGMFGDGALKMAVMIKALRIVFIIPVVIVMSVYMTRKASWRGMPWFLWLFIGAVILNFEIASPIFPMIYVLSKKMTMLPIFLMGLSFSVGDLRDGGLTPFVYAGVLWLAVSASVLGLILIL
jgi:uncharacterized integral membrane protein (TIGR00698 family)